MVGSFRMRWEAVVKLFDLLRAQIQKDKGVAVAAVAMLLKGCHGTKHVGNCQFVTLVKTASVNEC